MKKFFWQNTGITHYKDGSTYIDGYHNFCEDENGRYDYYIQEVALCYPNWTEEEKERTFKGAKFVWNCTGSHYNRLKAENIEDAKKEFEEYYEKMLEEQIKHYNEMKEQSIDHHRAFLRYKNKTGEYKEK